MRLTFALLIMLISSKLATAEVKVVVSIKPIHALVALVMQGEGTPGLIVSGSNSPHTYALKPSDAKALQEAQVIFWVGPELEAFLQKPLEALAQNAKTVALLDADGIQSLAVREGTGFDIDQAGDHIRGARDGHIWLDPENAKAMLRAIADTLSAADRLNAVTYQDNVKAASASIDRLTTEIAAQVAPIKGRGFIVFHDAYHYFENRFGLQASGAISINPENPPGAESITALRQRIDDGKVRCVFTEPQFDNKLVAVILEGSNAKSATLDPEGAALEPGPALYESVMRDITRSLVQCLR
jgi:zinc transport system substrate-binding protein